MNKTLRKQNFSRASSRGFTLIELLVVIGIIILLAALVIVSVSKSRARGRDAKRIADLSTIQLALEMYKDSNGKYPNITADVSTTLYWAGWLQSNVSSEWESGLGSSTNLAPYLSPLPKDPLNGKSGVKIITGDTCSSPTTESVTGAMMYVYRALNSSGGTTGDPVSYKLEASMEEGCNGLEDGGSRLNWYEVWGGVNGQAI